eukprot:217888-Chlamydomonas_euryale.AAC.1
MGNSSHGEQQPWGTAAHLIACLPPSCFSNIHATCSCGGKLIAFTFESEQRIRRGWCSMLAWLVRLKP